LNVTTPDLIYATYDYHIEDFHSIASGCFSVNCSGTVIVGGGWDASNTALNNVFEFTSNGVNSIQPLNTARSYSSAIFYSSTSQNDNNVLLVTGGLQTNSIEFLIMNRSFRINLWQQCSDKLPLKVSGHQLTILNKRIILTGGYIHDESRCINKVWEGKISFETGFRIIWSSLPSMLMCRSDHVAVVLENKLYCIGGYGEEKDLESSECYSFEENKWQRGPDLQASLSNAKGVVDYASQCIIMGGLCDGRNSSKVSLFDPQKGLIQIQGEHDIGRAGHVAVLL
jgi:hypothetical protein